MTKIEAYENKLIKEGMSKEAYAEYEALLKRVRGNFLRLQHCYTTAVQFPTNRSQEGIDLIQWALEKFPDTWFPTYSAYYNMGIIHERCRNYPAAYEAYRKAAEALGNDRISYQRTISGNLMWMLLHIEGFKYSEQLEQYYALFSEIDDFEKAFINNEYRIAVAEIVIYSCKGITDKAEAALERALRLSNPNIVSRIQGILDKHRVKDALKNTPECVAFLKTVKL
jgi:tetratricopeptide (TPR) repeat protein